MRPGRRVTGDVAGAGRAAKGDAQLPWPEEWPAHRPRLWMVLTVCYLGVLTLLAGGLGVWALLSSEPGPAVFLLAAGVYLGLVTALGAWLLRSPRRRSPGAISVQVTDSGENGIRIPYSGWLYRWLGTMMLLTFVVLAILVLSGLAGWSIPPFTSPPGAISVIVLTVAGLYCLWVVLEIAVGRLARGSVLLSPQGVQHRSLTFGHFVPWSAMQRISAVDGSSPLIVARVFAAEHARVRRTSRVGRQQEFQLLPDLVVRGRSLAVDPAVLYHALRYYHARPEARAELATELGLQRIRSADLLG